MPPSRRQPPRSSSTPPSRRPRVAGLRKPSTDESAAERTGQLPAVPAEPRKPRPRPAPRPVPRPAAKPEPFEATTGQLDTAPSAEDTAVFAAVGTEEEPEVDALTGEPVAEEEETPARPAPRRKKRDTGIAKPTEESEVAVADTASEAEPAAGSRVQKPYVVAGALVLVALVLGGLAFWFKYEEVQVSSATSNTALLDVAKTAQVKDSVSKAAEALFSYDFNNIKKTEDAANDLLANDDVRAKYNSLMGEVKRLAPEQKMVVTCKVTRSAVIMLNGDLAKVMVFVDQTSTRTDTKKTTAGTAQLHLNAQLQGDKWKITDMDTYNAPKVPAASQAPASSAPASPSPSK